MKPEIFNCHWIFADRMDFPIPVHIYNVHAEKPTNPDVYNVLNISNESELTRMSNSKVIHLSEYYDLILTWDEAILSRCKNAIFFAMGMCWLKDEDINNIKIEDKIFKVSTICGSKNLTHHHRLRYELWRRQKEIIMPKEFWRSAHNSTIEDIENNPILGPNPYEKIDVFKDSQFHIIIENGIYRNYFTEKIIDAVHTYTIPIYLGCPNIDSFLNVKGIIPVNSIDEIITVCNSLTPNYYEEHLGYVKENFELCKPYAKDFTDRVQKIILNNLDVK